MILTILFTVVYWLLYVMFSWLPIGMPFSDTVHTSAQWFGNSLMSLDFILPVTELFVIIPLVLFVVLARGTLRMATWIIGIVRGSGGHI